MQTLCLVTRKISLALTIAALPGGLVALCALALLVLLARTDRGRRFVARLTPQLPEWFLRRARAVTSIFAPPPSLSEQPLARRA